MTKFHAATAALTIGLIGTAPEAYRHPPYAARKRRPHPAPRAEVVLTHAHEITSRPPGNARSARWVRSGTRSTPASTNSDFSTCPPPSRPERRYVTRTAKTATSDHQIRRGARQIAITLHLSSADVFEHVLSRWRPPATGAERRCEPGYHICGLPADRRRRSDYARTDHRDYKTATRFQTSEDKPERSSRRRGTA